MSCHTHSSHLNLGLPEGNRRVGRPRLRWEECVCKELEECSIEWRRMASNPEEGQGSQRSVVPVMMMMMVHTAGINEISKEMYA
jgi:hypothetical protein